MATQTYEQLIAGANKIKENELPESNTHDIVGEQLLQMTNKMQEENSNNGKKFSELEREVIYDVSANNSGKTFASLTELLSDENLSTLIPSSVRCGGMSIRFIQSYDNKYVQYRLMADEFTTETEYWEGSNQEIVDIAIVGRTKGIDLILKEGCQVYPMTVSDQSLYRVNNELKFIDSTAVVHSCGSQLIPNAYYHVYGTVTITKGDSVIVDCDEYPNDETKLISNFGTYISQGTHNVDIIVYLTGTRFSLIKGLNIEMIVPVVNKSGLFNVPFTKGIWYNYSNGAVYYNNSYISSSFIRVGANKKYKIKNNPTQVLGVLFFNSSKVFISAITSLTDLTFETSNIPNVYYAVLTCNYSSDAESLTVTDVTEISELENDIDEIQVMSKDAASNELFVKDYADPSSTWHNTPYPFNSALKYKVELEVADDETNVPEYAYTYNSNSQTQAKNLFVKDGNIYIAYLTVTNQSIGFGWRGGLSKKCQLRLYKYVDLYEEARLSFGKVNSEYMIHCFGDSITESVEASEDSKRYPSILQTLVGKDYLVKNHGVAGASTLNIAARQGGIPIHLVNDLTFGSGVTSINPIESDFASNYPSIDSEWSAAIVNPSGFPDFNPAYIDGHKCNVFVTRSGSTNIMSLTLLDVDSEHTDPITLHAGSIVRFNGCNDSNNGITIIMMGTNGGWNWTGSVLAAQYRACANNVANNKYLILSYFDMTYENDGTYETYASVMAQNIDKIKEAEVALANEFGSRFVNMREQLVNNGLRYAIEGGYLTSAALSSENNVDAISKGYVPFGDDYTVQGHSKTDYHNGLLTDAHPNDAGDYAMARIVYEALVANGFV